MNIKIVTVGKLKEKYLREGIAEYTKRLKSYCKLEMVEVIDEKAPEVLSEKEKEQVKKAEGERILGKIKEQEFVFTLAIDGESLSSETFAQKIDQLAVQGKSQLTFVIGGSLGLSQDVLNRSDCLLSFGKLTYPHQLMRLILIEQVYRCFRINAGHAYHK